MNPLPNHGTKVLGGIVTVLGTIYAAIAQNADPAMLALLGKWAAPATLILGGVLTVLRGFQNSANAEAMAAAPKPVTPPNQKGSVRIEHAAALAAIAIIALVAGCQTVKSFNDSAYAAYGTADFIAQGASAALAAGKITPAQASEIAAKDAVLKSTLDAAVAAHTANEANGGDALSTTLTALNALAAYLQTLSGGH